MTEPKAKLSVGLIISLITTALAIAGGVAAIMGAIYAKKSEVQDIKADLVQEVHQVSLKAEKAAGDAHVRDWQIKTVQVQVQNIEQRQIQQTQNIEKLLTRFRVQPEPQPVMKALPAPPGPEIVRGTDEDP